MGFLLLLCAAYIQNKLKWQHLLAMLIETVRKKCMIIIYLFVAIESLDLATDTFDEVVATEV